MTCVKPMNAYWAEGGGITFKPKEGVNPHPFPLPCSQCIGCRLERSRQWATRCIHEATLHDRSCFVTLTYDQEHLPLDGGLDLEHWPKFAKRLRKRFGPFRYFQAGEYGDQTGRPHHHALIFGLDFRHDLVELRGGDPDLYRSPSLEKVWGMGACIIGNLTFESAAYVARYIIKKATGYTAEFQYLRWNEHGDTWWVQPEFATMSRNPGIGKGWYTKWKDDIYPDDTCVVRGKECRPPRYYDALLEKEDPEQLAELKERRRNRAAERAADLHPDRLKAKEVILKSKARHTKRTL